MTREETAKILYVIQAEYGLSGNAKSRLDIWQRSFDGYSYEQVNAGLQMYINTDTSGFAPHPGQILACIESIAPTCLSEPEAWALVQKAICNSGYHALEEFNKLPEVVKKAVGSPNVLREWGMSEELTSVKRDFGFAYRASVKRVEFSNKMPQNVKALIQNMLKEIDVDS